MSLPTHLPAYEFRVTPISASRFRQLTRKLLVMAQTLAANGAKVYITGRRVDVLETSARVHGAPEKLGASGGSIVPLAMDVASKDSVRAVVATITENEGFVNM